MAVGTNTENPERSTTAVSATEHANTGTEGTDGSNVIPKNSCVPEMTRIDVSSGRLLFSTVETIFVDQVLDVMHATKVGEYYKMKENQRSAIRLSRAAHACMNAHAAAIAIRNACDLRHELCDAGVDGEIEG